MRKRNLPLRVDVYLALVIAAIVFAAYANTFDVPFLLDDTARIEHNDKIRSLIPSQHSLETNRPIVDYTFAVDYAIHGLDVRGYHVVNLLIHLTSAWLLYGISRRSLQLASDTWSERSRPIAFFVAAIWSVHPLLTQAVTYINQRYESMMGLAYLASLYCLIRSHRSNHTGRWLTFSVAFCGLGMGCKEVMITAPLVLLLYDRTFISGTWSAIIARRKAYYVGLFATWSILAWSMLHYRDEYAGGGMVRVEGVTSWYYLLSQSDVLVYYLKLAFFPIGQCFWAAYPIAHTIREVWWQFALISLLALATLTSLIRWPKVGFLGAWFFLILSITSSVIPIRDLMFEHRMYLPLIGVLAGAIVGLDWMLGRIGISENRKAWVHAGICSLALVALTWETHLRNEVYRSEITLWRDTVEQSPQHAEAWHNLGLAYIKDGKLSEAIEALAMAYQLKPAQPQINASYGAALIQAGRSIEAIPILSATVDREPNNFVALRNLGVALIDSNQFADAIPFLERALTLIPDDLETQLSLSAALGMQGRLSESILVSEKILTAHPSNPQALLNLMVGHSRLGNTQEAISIGQRAVEANPNDAEAHGQLGLLLISESRDKAIEHLKTACRLQPALTEFQYYLGMLLTDANPSEAVAHFEAVLRTTPDNIEALRELASAFERSNQLPKALEAYEKLQGMKPSASDISEMVARIKKKMAAAIPKP